jgi:hypothetical protein
MRAAFALPLVLATIACGSYDAPETGTGPSAARVTVRIRYEASTIARTDLPPSLATCVTGVGPTHLHPSWRSFVAIPLTAAAADRWEITFTDVPVDTRLSFRISDGNVCSQQNPTGAATQSIFANDVLLTEIVTTPGSGPEPGLAFTVSPSGAVTP